MNSREKENRSVDSMAAGTRAADSTAVDSKE